MVCKFCGNENPEGLLHCSICGKELQNNLLRSLVGIQTDTQANLSLTGVANKGFEDTGGGAASGPQRPQASSRDKREGRAGSIFATVLAILTIIAVAAYFLFFRK